jgi:arylformamidase
MGTVPMTSDPFRIRDHVARFDAIVGEIIDRSDETRKRLPMKAGLSYGDGPNEKLDIFFPETANRPLPVHIFIHGGYWRMFSKRDYSYVADTVTAAGAIAVIVDYALMPLVRMATIVDQMRRARDWVAANIATHGGDPGRITVSGHSAGAHLATFLFSEPFAASTVRGALLLGGLYDLEPLRASFLQNEVNFTDREVANFSPLTHRHDPATRVVVAVGGNETPPFHRQADAFADRLTGHGVTVSRLDIDATDHMSSVRDLGIAGSDAAHILSRLIIDSA